MPADGMTRTITIASGKGGTGKTSISVNLALSLSELGHRACLFDADLGLGNVNIVLGLDPEHDLEDVVAGNLGLRDILIRDYHGIDIIPGSSGVEKIANLSGDEVERLIGSLTEFEGYDFVIFDTSAGVSKTVIAFCLASEEVVVILNPEPTSLTDSYALLKILALNGFRGTARVVMNQAKGISTATKVFDKFKEAVKRHLSIEVSLLGTVFQDPAFSEAVKSRQALVLRYPESNASKCVHLIARNLLKIRPAENGTPGVRSFLTMAMKILKSPLDLKGLEKERIKVRSAGTAEGVKSPHTASYAPGNDQETAGKAVAEAPAPVTTLQIPQDQNPDLDRSSEKSSPARTVLENGDMLMLLSQLVENVSSVSRELHLIRKCIEGKNDEGTKRGLSPGSREEKEEQRRRSVILDFETFAKQQSTTGGTGEENGKA